MRLRPLPFAAVLGLFVLFGSACASDRGERAEKRPTGHEVAREAGEATKEADDDLVLYSTSGAENTGEADADEMPTEGEPAQASEEEADTTGDGDEPEEADAASDGEEPEQPEEPEDSEESEDSKEADAAGDSEESVDDKDDEQPADEHIEAPSRD